MEYIVVFNRERRIFMGNADAIRKIYEIRNNFMLVGLTGRTGSGCTTVAKILKKKKFEDLTLKTPKTLDFHNADERKYRIVYKFMESNWKSFKIIEVSAIILFFAFQKEKSDLIDFINHLAKKSSEYIDIKDIEKLRYTIEEKFDSFFEKTKEINELETNDNKGDYGKIIDYYLNELVQYKNEFKAVFKNYTCTIIRSSKLSKDTNEEIDLYTYFMQTIGNNVRKYGDPYGQNEGTLSPYIIVEKIDYLIKIINNYAKNDKNKKVRICIDALRNPLEVIYFREKYRAFQLIAISTEEEDRRIRLSNLDREQINNIDRIEYPRNNSTELIFYHQNISKCLEISDIYLYNPNTNAPYYALSGQIIKYIALMLHPGLITPTHIERCMQLAYNARYNSGCLSRQVGAVITDADYSIKGVGWNDVPKGQVPFNLRDISEYCSDKNTEEYSKFELYNNKFEKALSRICAKIKNNADVNHDMLFQFCFKDVYNAIEGKGNQVHTRALHAEENAFLQISKYGGIGIKGGYLFTTASPCELCAKKAYQLGIKKIFYIDPYPGISKTHILDFGDKDNPEMALFEGAIGNAYLSLYAPKLPIKDELELKTGINIKSVAKNAFNERAFGEIEYELYTSNLKIINASDYDYSIERNVKNKTNLLEDMHHEFYWDGTSVELDTGGINYDEYKVINYENNNSLISYDVEPNVPKNKNENFNYKIKFKLTDREGNIENRLSCYMKHKTRLLRMCVESFKELDNVKLCLYADKEKIIMYKSFKFEDIVQEVEKNNKDNEVTFSYSNFNEMHRYCIEVKNPIMFYSYSIEWE